MKDIMRKINNPKKNFKSLICLGIGISLGLMWGIVLKNVPIGLLIGLCVGSYYAVITKKRIQEENSHDSNNNIN
ncbi:hypothetical protein IGJ28_002000 [Enterococcus sp. AZ091]|uniref:hypothetical protein n=1 Tax=Enterococcus sp. AZ091 TaxID=2774720 RepID=UPI003F276DA5